MLAEDYYPEHFFEIEEFAEVDDKSIKEWITFVEKSEPGITIGASNVIVFKNTEGDIIVADSYKFLPKETYERYKEDGEQLIEEVEDFLNEKRD